MLVIWGLLALIAASVVVLAAGGIMHLWKRARR